jgi:hypothetical protein
MNDAPLIASTFFGKSHFLLWEKDSRTTQMRPHPAPFAPFYRPPNA